MEGRQKPVNPTDMCGNYDKHPTPTFIILQRWQNMLLELCGKENTLMLILALPPKR